MEKLSLILNILLGGTSVFAVIQWILEKKKRAAELKGMEISNDSAQSDVDDKEFETLRKQLEFQDERIAAYESKMKQCDAICDEMRQELISIKKIKYDLESQVISLKSKLSSRESDYQRDSCMRCGCPDRESPKK